MVPITGSTPGAAFTDHLPRNIARLTDDLTGEFGPAMALPLGGEDISGVLLTVRRPGSPRFDERDLHLVSTFAARAALALQRAESQVPAAPRAAGTFGPPVADLRRCPDTARWDCNGGSRVPEEEPCTRS